MKRKIALAALLAMLLSGCAQTAEQTIATTAATEPEETTINQTIQTISAEEAVKEMKIGWNLGNTLDAPDGEMTWGNPATTPEMIELIRDLGFGAIRFPVSWHKHTSGAPEYTIDEVFMRRVQMLVDKALELDMYVILNSHHDCEVYLPTPENEEGAKTYLTAIWSQIAANFEYASDKLIFETMNEPRVIGSSYEWYVAPNNTKALESVEIVSRLNQTALDAIRTTGGNNAQRLVMVPSYAANPQAAMLPQFQLPQDSAEGKLIVSVHAYTPYSLCLDTKSEEAEFGPQHETEIRNLMKSLNDAFVSKGIPVIIGETGMINKNNPEDRYEWAKCFVSTAKEYDMPCFWWDNNAISGSGENFGLINRRKLKVFDDSQRAYEGLMEGIGQEPVKAE